MSFKTVCPNCGIEDNLFVTEVTLAATGRTITMHSQLESEGFIVPDDSEEDQSTENETVTCESCKVTMSLDTLYTDD